MNAMFFFYFTLCVCVSVVFGCFRFLVFLSRYFVVFNSHYSLALHTFTNLLLFGIFCLLLLLHIAVVARWKSKEKCAYCVVCCFCYFFCLVCYYFDKQAKFRNLLQMSYGHEFIFNLCVSEWMCATISVLLML